LIIALVLELSSAAAGLFKEEPRTILSSNFASFLVPDQYAVKNSKNEEVGLIVGNGLVVQLDRSVEYPFKFITSNRIS
jgi:hypothetical protein